MKIIGFAGSNSRESINKQLVKYALSLFENQTIELLDLNDYEPPLFGVDKLKKEGIPNEIKAFSEKIDSADLLVISLAEHNASYSTAFKNIYDWLSVMPNRTTLNKSSILLMATSPGERGGLSVLEAAKDRFTREGNNILETFSLPSFVENFTAGKGITSPILRAELAEKIERVKAISK
jgi:chromate reductase, NAD(P)H dehydrogenase (quinone)